MGALIPLALSLAPQLARWLFGPGGDETAKAIENAAVAVIGSAEPDAIGEAIKDPEKAAQLRLQLAQIAADNEKAERAAELDDMRVQLQDVASARDLEKTLAEKDQPLAWVPAVISGFILVIFAIVLLVVFMHTADVPKGFEQVIYVLLGTLAAMVTQVGNFWLGSSKGSADKQKDLNNAMNRLARSVPTEALPQLSAAAGGAADRPF